MRAWLDAGASTTQPPAGVVADAAAYGLLGVRLELDATSRLTLGARGQAGAGARTQDGRWVFGEARAGWTRPLGPVSARADATGLLLQYREPYAYDARLLRLQPGLRGTVRGLQLTLQGDFARGHWTTHFTDSSLPDPQVQNDGAMRLDGVEASLAVWPGPLDVEVGVALRDAVNGTLDARYTTLHATASAPVGPVTAFATLRLQSAASEQETGGEVGALFDVGSRATFVVLLTEPVTDPLFGTRSGFGVSLGASMRLHSTRTPTGIAVVGAAADGRRAVTLRVRVEDTSSLSVAGSFNDWTPVAMQRSGDEWTLTLHLAPGSYTFAFQRPDGSWFVPDDAPGLVDDGFGQRNATLVVSPL